MVDRGRVGVECGRVRYSRGRVWKSEVEPGQARVVCCRVR